MARSLGKRPKNYCWRNLLREEFETTEVLSEGLGNVKHIRFDLAVVARVITCSAAENSVRQDAPVGVSGRRPGGRSSSP